MSEENFWRSTPRKLKALEKVYADIEMRKVGALPQKPKRAFIDQVLPF